MSKLDINKIKVAPKVVASQFSLCVYGELSGDIAKWAITNNLKTQASGGYTNIFIPESILLKDIFDAPKTFEWLDGFSPNLNKKLHIGHFSNLVLGKAFKALDICRNTVSIYGDTLDGKISKKEAIEVVNKYQADFCYFIDKILFASEVKYKGDKLKEGSGGYIGTKVFEVDREFTVGIKSSGQTTYFYQDVALAEMLNSPTLYLTGKEQQHHFELLKKIYKHVHHIGLGLVKVFGVKMSSRGGDVILLEDFIRQVSPLLNGDLQLIYNVFAGFILKSSPEVDKGIDLNTISNPKNSAGLYISYTMARLFSAGCKIRANTKLKSRELEFALLKARINLKPSILFESLVEHCKDINSLYTYHTIKDNETNLKMFEEKLSDLTYVCSKLGLFVITKV